MEINEDLQNLTKKERKELRRKERKQEAQDFHRSRKIKRIALYSGIALVVLGGLFAMIKLGGSSPGTNQITILTNAISSSDWVTGNKQSKTILVEYGDFQCPACAEYQPLVDKVKQDFGDKIQFAFRNFPLSQHNNAKIAAYAAGAAGVQGKFWEMADTLYTKQSDWAEKSNSDTRQIFINYAQTLGLNIDKFKSDIDAQATKDKVENDYQSGINSKVDATPTFFLNGKKLQNPRSYDEFKNVIEQAINSNP